MFCRLTSIYFLVVVSIICWGITPILDKKALVHVSPLTMQVISSYTYSAIAPLMFLYMRALNVEPHWSGAGIAWTVLASVVATIGSLTFMMTMKHAHVYHVVGLTSVYPIVTFVLCAVFLGEPVTSIKLIGIVTIVTGVVILSW